MSGEQPPKSTYKQVKNLVVNDFGLSKLYVIELAERLVKDVVREYVTRLSETVWFKKLVEKAAVEVLREKARHLEWEAKIDVQLVEKKTVDT